MELTEREKLKNTVLRAALRWERAKLAAEHNELQAATGELEAACGAWREHVDISLAPRTDEEFDS